MLASYENDFAQHRERFLAEWRELLAFPSVSADPAHDADCRACAQWLAGLLERDGLAARLVETDRKPLVFAERRGAPDKPVVLFYGHYDVQPADPLEAWTVPPFAPEVRDGRMWGRGACDNKGQLFYALKAIETLIRRDELPVTIKILLEGEEESGSAGIMSALPRLRDLLRADVLLVTDLHMAPTGAPAIVMGLRGIIFLSLALGGPDRDLHSGTHGGVAPNPALEMARLLASLHDAGGRVAVRGFHDGVMPPSDREKALAAEGAPTAEAYRASAGVPPAGGEKGVPAAERAGFRPCLDANGIHSGYGGAGVKTIIPARAEAKLSARLVPGQDPRRCLDAISAHLRARAPEGLRLDIVAHGPGAPGFRLDLDSPAAEAARGVLEAVSGRRPVFLWEGASIPVVAALAEAAGAAPLLSGFGAEEDRVHAPDESFALDRFRLGYLYVANLLRAL